MEDRDILGQMAGAIATHKAVIDPEDGKIHIMRFGDGAMRVIAAALRLASRYTPEGQGGIQLAKDDDERARRKSVAQRHDAICETLDQTDICGPGVGYVIELSEADGIANDAGAKPFFDKIKQMTMEPKLLGRVGGGLEAAQLVRDELEDEKTADFIAKHFRRD